MGLLKKLAVTLESSRTSPNLKVILTEIMTSYSGSPVRKIQPLALSNRVAEYFTAMFRRKAFLHWYTGEGSGLRLQGAWEEEFQVPLLPEHGIALIVPDVGQGSIQFMFLFCRGGRTHENVQESRVSC